MRHDRPEGDFVLVALVKWHGRWAATASAETDHRWQLPRSRLRWSGPASSYSVGLLLSVVHHLGCGGTVLNCDEEVRCSGCSSGNVLEGTVTCPPFSVSNVVETGSANVTRVRWSYIREEWARSKQAGFTKTRCALLRSREELCLVLLRVQGTGRLHRGWSLQRCARQLHSLHGMLSPYRSPISGLRVHPPLDHAGSQSRVLSEERTSVGSLGEATTLRARLSHFTSVPCGFFAPPLAPHCPNRFRVDSAPSRNPHHIDSEVSRESVVVPRGSRCDRVGFFASFARRSTTSSSSELFSLPR